VYPEYPHIHPGSLPAPLTRVYVSPATISKTESVPNSRAVFTTLREARRARRLAGKTNNKRELAAA